MGRKETTLAITIVVNLGLIGLKFLLAAVSGSLSLRASAWHSFSDVLVSAFVLLGLFLVRRQRAGNPAAGEVSRIEHLVSLLVGGFIFYVGFDIFREALAGEEPELRHVFWVALAAAVTIALSYFMARYKTYVGRATGSPALAADGYHSLMDMYSSIVVVAGLLGYAIGFRSLDKVAAVVVVFFIALAGYEIVHDALVGLARGGHLGHDAVADPLRLVRAAAGPLGAVLAAMYLLSGVYTIQPGQVGVVRRFGAVRAAAVPPGLHYRLPWPIEEVTRVPLGAVQRAEAPASLMLTGDENLVDVAATVHYRVRDPLEYLVNVVQTADLVTYAAEAALRQTVGLRPVDALLTVDRAAIQEETRRQLQARLDASRAGLTVLAVQVTDASPPKDVASAFLDVASAREDRATYINEAVAYRNEIIPKARGEAEKQLREAEGFKAEKISNATGEASRFASRLAEYKKAPQVTRTRLYLEEIERVLPRVQKFLLSPEVEAGSLDLWFSRASAGQSGQSTPPVLPPPSGAGAGSSPPPAPPPARSSGPSGPGAGATPRAQATPAPAGR